LWTDAGDGLFCFSPIGSPSARHLTFSTAGAYGVQVTILVVGIDTTTTTIINSCGSLELTSSRFAAPIRRASIYTGRQTIPKTTIIDHSGTVRRKFVGPVNWNSPEILEYLQKS